MVVGASIENTLMKPEESYSARDTLCRLEEELINLDEHPLVIIESLSRRLLHPIVREIYDGH